MPCTPGGQRPGRRRLALRQGLAPAWRALVRVPFMTVWVAFRRPLLVQTPGPPRGTAPPAVPCCMGLWVWRLLTTCVGAGVGGPSDSS